MSYTEELATVMTLCQGRPPLERTTLDCRVNLSNPGPDRTHVGLNWSATCWAPRRPTRCG